MRKSKVMSFVIVSFSLTLFAFIVNQRSGTAAPPDTIPTAGGSLLEKVTELEQRVATLESKPSVNLESGRVTASFSSGNPTIIITFSRTFINKPVFLIEPVPTAYSVTLISVTNTQATIQVFRSSVPDPIEVGYLAVEP